MGDCGNNVRTTPCHGGDYNYGCGSYLYADCEGDDQGSSNFGVYSPCYGYGSSSPCGNNFYLYQYGSCDDSGDYDGNYGYLDCGNNVRTTPCYGGDYNYGCGSYLYADCDGNGDGSSNYGVYSPCYGYGYGYPCGGIDYSNDCNGYFGDYGYSSSSPCGNNFYLYNYGVCDESDDYDGAYGYLDCGNNVRTTPCYGGDYNFGCGTYLYADCEGDEDGSSSIGVYSPCYGRGYGYPCRGI